MLSSGYAYLFGQPLSLFGTLTYGSVLFSALALNSIRSEQQQRVSRGQAADPFPTFMSNPGLSQSNLRYLLVGGSALLVSTSAYLMYVLFGKLEGEWCTYCFGSAILSSIIFGITATKVRPSPHSIIHTYPCFF